VSRIGQLAIAGKLTAGSSPSGAIVSACSVRAGAPTRRSVPIAPPRRIIASLAGEDTNDFGSALDLQRIDGMQLGSMLGG